MDRADIDALLLALAILALDRPGWYDYLRSVAEKLDGIPTNNVAMFEQFHTLNSDRWKVRSLEG